MDCILLGCQLFHELDHLLGLLYAKPSAPSANVFLDVTPSMHYTPQVKFTSRLHIMACITADSHVLPNHVTLLCSPNLKFKISPSWQFHQYSTYFTKVMWGTLSLSIECSLWLLVASLVGTRLCRWCGVLLTSTLLLILPTSEGWQAESTSWCILIQRPTGLELRTLGSQATTLTTKPTPGLSTG